MGWTTIQNGELPALAAAQFDVFVTVDRDLAFQQDVASVAIAVVVIRAKSNRLGDLKAAVPSLLAAIASARAGEVTFVEG